MQCFEFEMTRAILARKLAEMGLEDAYDTLDLADVLLDHGVTRVDRLPDIVSIARNLEAGVPLAA